MMSIQLSEKILIPHKFIQISFLKAMICWYDGATYFRQNKRATRSSPIASD
jgi:hypothetical protein